MKPIFTALLILLFPVSIMAQETEVVKRQADQLAQALLSGDYKTIVDNTYPGALQMYGGKEKMLSVTTDAMKNMKALGITFEKVSIGYPGKFYTAGAEIHCLVPETIRLKVSAGHKTVKSYLLGISADGGKNWSFIDISAGKDEIAKLFPHFNTDLKIPDATPPVEEP